MKINCISCGHSFALDEAYDDFSGFVKCYVCGGLLEIKTTDGKLRFINMAGMTRAEQNAPETGLRAD